MCNDQSAVQNPICAWNWLYTKETTFLAMSVVLKYNSRDQLLRPPDVKVIRQAVKHKTRFRVLR